MDTTNPTFSTHQESLPPDLVAENCQGTAFQETNDEHPVLKGVYYYNDGELIPSHFYGAHWPKTSPTVGKIHLRAQTHHCTTCLPGFCPSGCIKILRETHQSLALPITWFPAVQSLGAIVKHWTSQYFAHGRSNPQALRLSTVRFQLHMIGLERKRMVEAANDLSGKGKSAGSLASMLEATTDLNSKIRRLLQYTQQEVNPWPYARIVGALRRYLEDVQKAVPAVVTDLKVLQTCFGNVESMLCTAGNEVFLAFESEPPLSYCGPCPGLLLPAAASILIESFLPAVQATSRSIKGDIKMLARLERTVIPMTGDEDQRDMEMQRLMGYAQRVEGYTKMLQSRYYFFTDEFELAEKVGKFAEDREAARFSQ
ncbi:hypothetical protein B0T16DRAFT_456118 [Cercophora newfieldiana]|uniref:Uncharacterized protein n=1 Tax=Cercophora newfieldiana TaxID=92897 RepID=A0AA39YB16_9PEZI|nr:hypothetical protein B0T16DRAFT_456118 [Cercophora newfieldiana]